MKVLMPADGMDAAASNQDLDTSGWQLTHQVYDPTVQSERGRLPQAEQRTARVRFLPS
jgi:hypothetical protein